MVAERKRDDVLPFEVVGDLPQFLHGLRRLGHEALVVVDDYLLDLYRNPVDRAVVGGPLLGPVVDVPALLFVGILKRAQESRVGQDAAETRACIVGENVGWIVGLQPGLYDIALTLRRHRLALQRVLRVLLLEPVDLYLYERLLLGGRLRGTGEELDDLAPTLLAPATARDTQKRRTREPRAAEPQELPAAKSS